MQFPNVVLRRDPQILAALVAAKRILATDKSIAWVCEAIHTTKSPLAAEICEAISDALHPFAFFSTWVKEQDIEGDVQALRHQWLDLMILDQIELPVVKLRRRPEIKAILLEAKDRLAQHRYLCIAVSHACLVLSLNDFFHEVTNAILDPLGSRESATDYFREQYADLSDDQCQALRHRWLDQLIKEQL